MNKMKVDLITGFLGAGKTTFIIKYREFCRNLGEIVHIIENEFCVYDVDSEILSRDGERPISLAGECMCCTGKEHFKQLLTVCAKEGYHRILVEPSGIYDVTEFFSVMDSEEVSPLCEIGNIITIFDPAFAKDLEAESEELMIEQLLVSGVIVLSKSSVYSEKDFADGLNSLGRILAEYGINAGTGKDGVTIPVCTKDWEDFAEEDYRAFMNCGFRRSMRKAGSIEHKTAYQTLLVKGQFRDFESLDEKLETLFHDPSYGCVLRLKGYIKDNHNQSFLLNCTPEHSDIQKCAKKRGIMAVIGNGMNGSAIKQLLAE